jgi:cytoskeletal protein CcmA (bactofilin family)
VSKRGKDFSIIDRNLTVDGAIEGGGTLMIKGTVKGNINGDVVVITPEGSALATIEAASVTIGGCFEGEVRASKEVIILSTGTCSGAVICGTIAVESGGMLNASVTCEAFSANGQKAEGTTKNSQKG